jgi:hypothetical protein
MSKEFIAKEARRLGGIFGRRKPAYAIALPVMLNTRLP